MGEVFRYIADSVLPARRLDDLPCPVCGKTGDVFHCFAEIDFPGDGVEDISEACASCIRNYAAEQVSELATEKRLPAYLNATPGLDKNDRRARLEAIRLELRRTPRLPHFIQ